MAIDKKSWDVMINQYYPEQRPHPSTLGALLDEEKRLANAPLAPPEYVFAMGPSFGNVNTRDVLYPAREEVAKTLWSKLPSNKDLSDEACREIRRRIPGIEIMGCADSRAISVGDHVYSRDQFYGNLAVDHEYGYGPSTGAALDRIRGSALQFAREFGAGIAITVHEAINSQPGYYPKGSAGTFRIPKVTLMAPISGRKCWSHDTRDFALIDDITDGFLLRFASYFFVTPQGKEIA